MLFRSQVVIFYENNHKLDYCLLDYGTKNNSCKVRDLKDKSFLRLYSDHAVFYSGCFEKPSVQSLYYFDDEWRFDLKKIKLNADGFKAESQIDFRQSDPARNPKYYEFTKMVKGNFFGSGTDCFLIIMRNCLDADFDGTNCREFEEAKGQPSGYLFYRSQTSK